MPQIGRRRKRNSLVTQVSFLLGDRGGTGHIFAPQHSLALKRACWEAAVHLRDDLSYK